LDNIAAGGGAIPENIAAQLLADGDIALRGLHDEQRGANIHRRQRLQFLINNLATLLVRVGNAAVVTGAGLQTERVKWVETESAFASRIQTGAVVNLGTSGVDAFLEEAQPVFLEVMERLLQRHKAVKVNAVLVCEFSILHDDAPDTKSFNTKNAPIWPTTDLDSWFIEYIKETFLRDLEDFQEKDSGWNLQAVSYLTLNINKYNPIRGSGHIEIPGPIAHREACINVRTDDEMFFKWAVLSGLYPAKKDPQRKTKYVEQENKVSWSGLDFPFKPKRRAKI